MKTLRGVFFSLLLLLVAGASAHGVDQPVFGPTQYDVKVRHGKPNRYKASFPAREGTYVIKIQNGANIKENVDWLQCTVNGIAVVREDTYSFPFIAAFVKLQNENTLEIAIRDHTPTGLRRPRVFPKNVVVTVLPVTQPALAKVRGSYETGDWNGLNNYMGLFLKITPPGSELALESMNVEFDLPRRTQAMRKLIDMKQKSAEEFFLRVFNETWVKAELRADALFGIAALHDKKHIPTLMTGFVDPEEIVSVASARGLSSYPEADTQDHLMKTLEKMDSLRQEAAIRTIVKAEWKPISTMLKLADSTDNHISDVAISVLGGMQTKRATDYLLTALEAPGKRRVNTIVTALGSSGDGRAIEPLLALASNKAKRGGMEPELAEALALLGDQRAAELIRDMGNDVTSSAATARLRAAYSKLTGK